MKLVSVVVATYRRDIHLKNALESLANQNYTNIEIIVVDDNGDLEWNKKVFDVVEEFCENFPEVSVFLIANEINQGSAKTRNIGIEAANGDYITFLDDDDVYLPNKIKNQVEFMERCGCDYSITDLILYNDADKMIDKRIRSYIKETSVSSLTTYHLKYHMTGTDTMMFKKEYLNRIGGFAPIDVGDEFYLMQRAIDGEGRFGYLPECEIKAYVHAVDGGISSGEGKIKGENALFEYKKKFFDQLTQKDIRYIKTRHYLVLAFASLRKRAIFSVLKYTIWAFGISPITFAKLLISR